MTGKHVRTTLPTIRQALADLGNDIQLARRRRRLRQKDFAEALSVSVDTVRRLEAGDPGLSIGTLCRACLALGHLEAMRDLIDRPEKEASFLFDPPPERIRHSKAKPAPPGGEGIATDPDWDRGVF